MIKKSKYLSWQNTILWAILFLGLIAVVLALIIPQTSIGAKCDIKGIKYTNVCPNECWTDSISCEHCPLPTDLSCDLRAKAPIIKLYEIIK